MSGPEYGPDDEIRDRAGEVMGPRGPAKLQQFATGLVEELIAFAKSSGIAELERRCSQELRRRRQPTPALPTYCKNCSGEIRKVVLAAEVPDPGEIGTWFHIATQSPACPPKYAAPAVDGPAVT